MNDKGKLRPIFIPAAEMYTQTGAFAPVVPEGWRIQQDQLKALSARGAAIAARTKATGVVTAAQEPCGGVTFAESELESLVVRDSFESTVRNATAIILGRIERVTPGFFYGKPGSLIKLTDLDRIKAGGDFGGNQETIYVRHPYAHFVSAGTAFCRETGPGVYVPAAGDRLLVFAFGHAMDEHKSLIYSTSQDLIAVPAEGALSIPRLLRFLDRQNATIDSIVAELRRGSTTSISH